ncbi:hypothetical protein F5050DRAFT_1793906 [Lentinula boryana]|uniref:Uncharacterized protein n=1 Tax=Lentinula boryana TaxID=40481 RepID=A0ABQ8PYG2_9AGAR|nr:hypothetical protein F5050DRAFT_1793906 [Lentinula boryana]
MHAYARLCSAFFVFFFCVVSFRFDTGSRWPSWFLSDDIYTMLGPTVLLHLLLTLLTCSNFVNAAAWVAGFQSTGFVGWNLRQYTHLFEGNPRQVATLLGADDDSLPGVVCGNWLEFKIIGNSNPGSFRSFRFVSSLRSFRNSFSSFPGFLNLNFPKKNTLRPIRIQLCPYTGRDQCQRTQQRILHRGSEPRRSDDGVMSYRVLCFRVV